MPKFGRRSKKNLDSCDLDIQAVLNEAIKYYDFSVLCGERGEEEQTKAFKGGFSKVQYPNSRHNKKPSQAVDIAPYPIDWADLERFHYLAGLVIGIAQETAGEFR